jgi:hypothetical protein
MSNREAGDRRFDVKIVPITEDVIYIFDINNFGVQSIQEE